MVLTLLCGSLAYAQRSAPSLSKQQQEAIDDAVRSEMESQQLVGVAVGVLRNGRVVFVRGYGMADREKKIPVTERTVFNWASNSKPFIAVAAMQLVERGDLDLDADIRQYLPELPDKGSKVTVRHLLCHQSGFPHYSNGLIVPLSKPPDDPLQELDPVVALNRFGASPLIFCPGERFEYSSYAFVILTAIVQRAGKAPISEQLTERIVEPLGLRNVQLDLPYNGQQHWTIGYRRNKGGQVEVVKDKAHHWSHGAGGYKSDIVDFARWAEALLNTELLDKKTENRMWTAQITTDGKRTSYGLGSFIKGSGKKLKVSHSGGDRETATRLVLYPRQRHGVVVLCNSGHGNPGKISTAVYRALSP